MIGRLRRTVAIAALTIASLGLYAGTAHAAPALAAPAPAQSEGDIGYEARIDGDSVVSTIDSGLFRVSGDGDTVEVVDGSGKVVAAVPLTLKVGEQVFRIDQEIVDRTLTLTPQVPQDVVESVKATAASPSDIAQEGPQTQAERDSNALGEFSSYLGYATLIGGLVFALVFGVVGLVVGCIVVPAVGCLPGLMGGVSAGSLAGTIFVGGPALVILGIQYLTIINTPFVPPGEEEPAPA
ncbi:hypothetical protein G4H71_13580 [Rhodococcus triatomae]|uniref:DUF8020 domain-containing protein n=1 Tax=Rhodococcus triatomae TaxID=300028 RepID=A0A1G8PQ71_9NOCA|nr:hypothetical protein [Rhodococcus triatomae]QNG20166.1 hypothetical protein G4H72_16795 [Rhodococcus triatomae]QNG23918.1 hypothetical protein G4H71_13580 [Rhodococcus triatomae]SDI94583.1 hypothetical protein SAMN05444695_113104 [Rhodococcus triatomae]